MGKGQDTPRTTKAYEENKDSKRLTQGDDSDCHVISIKNFINASFFFRKKMKRRILVRKNWRKNCLAVWNGSIPRACPKTARTRKLIAYRRSTEGLRETSLFLILVCRKTFVTRAALHRLQCISLYLGPMLEYPHRGRENRLRIYILSATHS